MNKSGCNALQRYFIPIFPVLFSAVELGYWPEWLPHCKR